MTAPEQARSKLTEDWVAVLLGLAVVALSLLAFAQVDPLGWVVKAKVWKEIGGGLAATSAHYKSWSGYTALLVTLASLTAVLTGSAAALGLEVRRFARGFVVILLLTWVCYVLGNYAYVAATKDKLAVMKIGWSMNLTGEAGYLIALLLGLGIGNASPKLVAFLREAIRPELYIKIAIVLLGAVLGVKSAEALGLASSILLRGLCAIIEAYLIYWALVYFVARKYFRFNREWAAPLASGISICGVSAAIATGSAIRARPIVPIMVSSLVVLFAMVEMLVLPFIAQQFLWHDPMVAGAWMGLAVKTDGAAVASGAITDSLIRAKILADQGIAYQEGWITMTATTVKVFIDMFIGVWAFVLAIVWCTKINPKVGERVRVREIWERFPKFVLGYLLGFILFLALALSSAQNLKLTKGAVAGVDSLRVIFFALTFFCIGLVSDFRQLKQQGIGKLAAVYGVCLFGFILWIGLIVSWLFFHGMTPPRVPV
jgi:uncharacterized membrane protein YadS